MSEMQQQQLLERVALADNLPSMQVEIPP